MEKMCKVSVRLVVLLGIVSLFPFLGNAQTTSDYPNRPIQHIVGFAAGGATDLLNRALAPKMGEVLGQPVMVVNKTGAAGQIALIMTAKAKPDGYTIGGTCSAMFCVPHMEKTEYDVLTDFTFIAGTASQPYAIAVRSDAPWKTLQELVDDVKKNPGKIKYGHFGIGGLAHIYMEALALEWKLNWVQVPFKGEVPSITALLGGHVPVIACASGFVPHMRAGKMRALALLTAKRSSACPEVPTLKELGLKMDFRMNEVLGVLGPKGMPPEIVKKLENAIQQGVETAEFKKVVEVINSEAFFRNSQDFTNFFREVYPQVGEIIKRLGLSMH